ncbi:unnamed protein product, partial [Owenia fusiformis]
VNPAVALVIEAMCTNCVSEEGVLYNWKLYKEKLGGTFEEVTDVLGNDSSRLNTKGVTIPAGGLEEGGVYQMKSIISKEGELDGFNTHTIISTFLPWGGRCSVEPLEGTALQTVFKLSCFDWMDEG